MDRPSMIATLSPIDVVKQYARCYAHGKEDQYTHLFFFSTIKSQCEALTMFGGKVYRQRGGYAWILSSRKHLAALFKLMESDDFPQGHEMYIFKSRMEGTA